MTNKDPARAAVLYCQATMLVITINSRLSRRPEISRMVTSTVPKEELSQETRRLVRVGHKAMQRMERLKLLAHSLAK